MTDQKKKRDIKLCGVCNLPLIPRAEWRKGIHDVCKTIEESVGAEALRSMPLADIREVKTKIEFHRWVKRNDIKNRQEVKKPGIWIDPNKRKKSKASRRIKGKRPMPALATAGESKKKKRKK